MWVKVPPVRDDVTPNLSTPSQLRILQSEAGNRRQYLFRLQKRLFKAIREGNTAKARNLQKLILKSRSARLLAIRQVTQLNQGKKTAGLDGKKALTFKERFELEEFLKVNWMNWKHQGLKEHKIPKKDGTVRMLKIPTIQDRAWQCLCKYAVEPAHEAVFHERSYGFRPGRSTHDCQKMVFLQLKSNLKGASKRIISLDIEKCFDRIDHYALMGRVFAPQKVKLGLWRCLKAGSTPGFPQNPGTTEMGTPQGGVISPLCNLRLLGEERVHLHHVDSNHNNWKAKNLLAVHQSCHQYVHMSKPGKD